MKVLEAFLLLKESVLRDEKHRCQTGSMERTNQFVLSVWNPKQLKILGRDLSLSPTLFVPHSQKSAFLLFTLPFVIFQLLVHCGCYNPE